MSETAARTTAFGNGYQAALKDLALAFHNGDLPALASWITQNLSADSIRELGAEVVSTVAGADVWAADNADPTPWPQGSADPAARDAVRQPDDTWRRRAARQVHDFAEATEQEARDDMRQLRHDDALIASFGAREAGRLIELEQAREARDE